MVEADLQQPRHWRAISRYKRFTAINHRFLLIQPKIAIRSKSNKQICAKPFRG
jgi:hypothetical protein